MPVITPAVGEVARRAEPQPPAQPASNVPAGGASAGGESSSFVRVFGDLKRSGRFRLDDSTTGVAIFGDVFLDLREAELPARVELTVYTLFGDVKIIVPPGVTVQVSGFALFGDDKIDGTSPAPGGPTLAIHRVGAFGDVKVKTAMPGEEIPKRWKWF